MAFVAMGGPFVTGGVLGQDITEGCAVQISPSGLHYDLPTVLLATSGATNVFVALATPDQFARPTMKGFFSRNSQTVFNNNDAQYNTNLQTYLIESGQRGPQYLVGPSLLEEPILYSGWMVQLHQGGAYSLTTANYVDSASIRQAGQKVQVGANGKFQAASANIVGWVREYRADNGHLVIVLDQRSA
jgi:hypothetical protein